MVNHGASVLRDHRSIGQRRPLSTVYEVSVGPVGDPSADRVTVSADVYDVLNDVHQVVVRHERTTTSTADVPVDADLPTIVDLVERYHTGPVDVNTLTAALDVVRPKRVDLVGL